MSSRGDSASCPQCGSPLRTVSEEYDVVYCPSCGYRRTPPDLRKRHGITVGTSGPNTEPVIIKLIDPALEELARPIESRFVTEIRSEGTPANPSPTLDNLTPTAWKLLRAIRQLGAVNSEKAVGRSEITAKARTGNHDSKHNQEAFKQASGLGLITAKRNAGTWLTQAGIDALDKRSGCG
jgi:hypothetical protein